MSPSIEQNKPVISIAAIALVLNLAVLGGTIFYNGGILSNKIETVNDAVSDLKKDFNEFKRDYYSRLADNRYLSNGK